MSDRITARVEFSNERAPDSFPTGSNAWRVELRYQRRRMTVPFYTGPAITRAPTAADVMECIASDAAGYENAGGFEEWADEYGYDPDSRRAEQTYREVEAQAKRLRRFLRDDYHRALFETDLDGGRNRDGSWTLGAEAAR